MAGLWFCPLALFGVFIVGGRRGSREGCAREVALPELLNRKLSNHSNTTNDRAGEFKSSESDILCGWGGYIDESHYRARI